MKIIAASLLIVGVISWPSPPNYPYTNNSNILYAPSLDCTGCIRSGNDFCLMSGPDGNSTTTTWTCNNFPTVPEAFVTNGTVTANAYICSNYMND